MFNRNVNVALFAIALSAATSSSFAVVAQEPLLNRPNTVSPNLSLILDTSGSMGASFIFQYGGTPNGYGMQGPSDTTYAKYSPDVNLIYYDPRTRYAPRIDFQGNDLPVDPPSGSWYVYFRIGTGPYTDPQLGSLTDYYSTGTPAGYTPASPLVVAGSTARYPNYVKVSGGGSLPASTVFPKFLNRTDCIASTTSCSFTEERQNHQNWQKWYSTRGKMAVTGLGAAFQPLKADSIRLGYGTIGQLSGGNFQQGVSSYSDTVGGVKDNFFSWLYASTFTTSTPNLAAINDVGKYHLRTDSDGPWSTVPNPNSTGITTVATPTGPGKAELPSAHASCRRSFSMLVTDGYSNGAVPTTAGNADNTGFSISPAVGPAFVYVPKAPYRDNASNTLADIAMYYWGRDLRGDLSNRVPTINANGISNPSTWQNLSFYAVTLGIIGTLPQTPATIANIVNGTPWPTPVADDPTTIDDMWHATINARGEMLNAGNAPALTAGLKKMFDTIAGTPQTLSGVAVSTTFLKNGTRKYKPEYVPGTWSGKLSAIELNATTGNDKVPTNTFWQVESGVDAQGNPISLIPPFASRNVFTWNGTSAVNFNAANSGLSTTLVNYIRGDSSNELRKTGGTYRSRDAVLGDIVNSSPAYILDNVDLNYEKLGYTDYRAFIASKVARTEGVLFVGANDGMLHAFRDSTGAEIFAFVPQAVLPNLNKLTDFPYTHQYYVDGPNIETDAYLDGAWKNLLLGTTGAGAKAVYALDVTAPTTMNASKVLWEVNDSTTGFGNLGYVLSDVQAGRVEAPGALANDDWVGVFGNGFASVNGYASLYVVNLKTGALLKEIVADTSGSNGLGGVRIVRDANQRIIGAYAGDIKGNLWKFDLTGTNKSSWGVGLAGQALYSAGTTKPITATPSVLAHPNGGYMVTFGTGKFYESTDTVAPFKTQRVYGVWDNQAFGATSTPAGASFSGITALQQQTIGTVTISSVAYYTLTSNPITWGNGLSSGVRGWYIDLPNSGQRVAYPVERLQEKSGSTFLLISTISPVSSAATDLCVQSGSGSGWVYLVDGITGSGPTKQAFDTNGDGVIDASDLVIAGYQDPVDGRPTSITISSNSNSQTGCIVTAQNTCSKYSLACGQPGMPACPPTPAPGAVSIKSREWRQLFMR